MEKNARSCSQQKSQPGPRFSKPRSVTLVTSSRQEMWERSQSRRLSCWHGAPGLRRPAAVTFGPVQDDGAVGAWIDNLPAELTSAVDALNAACAIHIKRAVWLAPIHFPVEP